MDITFRFLFRFFWFITGNLSLFYKRYLVYVDIQKFYSQKIKEKESAISDETINNIKENEGNDSDLNSVVSYNSQQEDISDKSNINNN